ncbi:hypothetical protein K1X22_22790 [Mycolicibacterium farcinogenes]|uniref:hypothetical protein n=1 Tax=Mycolicibacterium TaxID=1866885 RepID=UPI00096E7F5A|nr:MULTISPECIES: hypothetical protein [Mycolicibacterium]OMB86388.1 hypothetical protein A5743_26170 [Mycolicibacterium conceptionense]QZH59035.1 hypothetical protein K1X22_22790 [Mycolicibacterium farcinogenes]
MKLARPDVFHPRIVLAGCAASPEGDGDDAGLVTALRNRGLHARWLAWDDPETLDADLVILRATWDYPERLDEFLAWTRSVPHLINSAQIVQWNTGNCYLDDLHRTGVPVAASGCSPQRAGDVTALVFLGGRPSHAFPKATLVPPAAGESSTAVDPDEEVWRVGRQAVDAVIRRFDLEPEDLVYARADVVGGPEGPRLLALKLVEPALGFRRLDQGARQDAERRFAVGVEGALERFGLGPLSHRGG